MSLKSWKQEFYPISAKSAARGSMIKAIEHSLLKWKGLSPSNIKKHDVHITQRVYGVWLEDGTDYLHIDASSCALCEKYHDNGIPRCQKCPLYIVRDNTPCDQAMEDESKSPYGIFQEDGDHRPMVRFLKKALKWANENK